MTAVLLARSEAAPARPPLPFHVGFYLDADVPCSEAYAAAMGDRAFTTWEQQGYSVRIGSDQLADHRPLLEKSGFTIETHEEPADWRRQQTALAEGLIAAQAEMSKEMQPATAAALAAMGRGVLDDMTVRPYVCVVAKKL